ncbi:hypothetical protein ACGGAQ_08385 [Micromonospora sp. NPDC047557]
MNSSVALDTGSSIGMIGTFREITIRSRPGADGQTVRTLGGFVA